jgi:tyrosinase
MMHLTDANDSNVDRLFAIWQALNPTSYDINEQSGSGTFVISSNGIETDTTPLAPFNDASGRKFYNSQVVRSTEAFNYAYPETQRWSFSSDNDYLESVQKAVDELYGSISGQAASDLMTASAALPATPIIKEKVVHDSTQKPSSTSGAPVHSSSPIHVTSTSVSGHSPELNENFRGLNLGSEIGQGKCSFPLNFLPY